VNKDDFLKYYEEYNNHGADGVSDFYVSDVIYQLLYVLGESMINVIASIRVKESCMDEFLDIFKSNISNVLNENRMHRICTN